MSRRSGGRGTSRVGKGDFRFRIGIDPSPARLARVFGELGPELLDMRPAWDRLAPAVAAGIGRGFDSAQEPLKSSYADRKRRLDGFTGGLLVRTGKLRAALTTTRGVITRGKRLFRFGVRGKRFEYAPALNFGSSARNIPARNFMGWSRPMRNAAERAINEHIEGVLAKATGEINRG